MSTINLQGATSGTIALVPTAIAGSNTLTLPAETGTLRSTVSTGTVLQALNYQTGAVATGTTQIPYDDTIPQNTEGDQYMSLAITPRSASSKLQISVVFCLSLGAANYVTMALFQDSTAGSLAAVSGIAANVSGAATYPSQLVLDYEMTSGTTGSTTFKVRAGPGGVDTLTFNGQSGARRLGGVFASSITITEVVP